MPDIKTREVVKGTIKTLDRTALAGEKMKEAYVQIKEKAETSYQASENSAEEYAANKITNIPSSSIVLTEKTLSKGKGRINSAYKAIKRSKKLKHKKYVVRVRKFNFKTAKNKRPLSREMKEAIKTRRNLSYKSDYNTFHNKRRVKYTARKDIKAKDKWFSSNNIKVKKPVRSVKSKVNDSRRIKNTAVKTKQNANKHKYKQIKLSPKKRRGIVNRRGQSKFKRIIKKLTKIIVHTKSAFNIISLFFWISVMLTVTIVMVTMIATSCFGIFFSGEDTGSEQTMQEVVREINEEYQNKIESIKNNNSYDVLEISGYRVAWPEVLSIYAVKTTTDLNNPQEVATLDDNKIELLREIFWEMNDIRYRTEDKSETAITETDDGHGNIVETETTVTRTYLYITVSHKTADRMAAELNFNTEQREQLSSLLDNENNSLWAAVLYGIGASDDAIVTVALSQIGNVGGQPYWSWYGFGSRVEWCACFVSWCANECGYIDDGIFPKFSVCMDGVNWFKEKGRWLDGDVEPEPGMIIFFDWDDENGQDGIPDHVGIVEKVENGRIYTIEGNSDDACKQKVYSEGCYEILGYVSPK